MDLLSSGDHRQWPVPRQHWVMAQTWHNLLFAHWPVPVGLLRSLVPEPLEVDTFHGQAWVGIIPFRLTAIRLRWLPPLPLVSAFTEINVRTYVTLGGKPGVFFLSMDANNRLGTAIARPTFRVPYKYAALECARTLHGYEFYCERREKGLVKASFESTYRPVSSVFRSQASSVEQWLTDRYCYYSVADGRPYRCEIAHASWPFQRASATITGNTMASALGIELPAVEPLLLYAHRMDAVFWWPRRVANNEIEQNREEPEAAITCSPALPGIRRLANRA